MTLILTMKSIVSESLKIRKKNAVIGTKINKTDRNIYVHTFSSYDLLIILHGTIINKITLKLFLQISKYIKKQIY